MRDNGHEWVKFADRPIFRPRQIMNEVLLNGLGDCFGSRIAGESQRHGWGVVCGLLPHAPADGGGKIGVSPGIAADQNGGLLLLNEALSRPLELLIEEYRKSADENEKQPTALDLWLLIELKPDTAPWTYSTSSACAYAPESEPRPDDPDKKIHKPEDPMPGVRKVTPDLKLYATTTLSHPVNLEKQAFDKFEEEFKGKQGAPRPRNDEDLDKLKQRRSDALAKLAKQGFPHYPGVPLGRVQLSWDEKGSPRIVAVDWGEARREHRPFELPAHPDHINVAPLYGMNSTQAVAWLAQRGVQVSHLEDLVDWERLSAKLTSDTDFLRAEAQIRTRGTARLFCYKGRVLVVQRGALLSRWTDDVERLNYNVELLTTAVVALAVFVIFFALMAIVSFRWNP